MAIAGYIHIDDVPGESMISPDDKNIDVLGVEWEVQQAASAMTGSGRSRGRPTISEMSFLKLCDAASPYIALAAMQGKSFPEVKLVALKSSGTELLPYLTVKMTNCMFSRYKMHIDQEDLFKNERNDILEKIGISFEKIDILYVVQAEDHSQGDEHQVEFDLASGV